MKAARFVVILLLFSFFTLFVKRVDASTVSYIHTDHQGSVVEVTDESGNPVEHERYFSYGESRLGDISEQLAASERKYTGQIKDDSTDLYYYNARYYDPYLSVFVSADEIDDQLNRYVYVGNNSINYIDPTGEQSEVPWEVMVAKLLEVVANGNVRGSYVSKNDYLESPQWFRGVMAGDVSQLPPMGFRTLEDASEYVLSMGVDSFIDVGNSVDADRVMLQYQKEKDNDDWEDAYWNRFFELKELHPTLHINTLIEDTYIEMFGEGSGGNLNRTSNFPVFNQINVRDYDDYEFMFGTLDHEYTHFLDFLNFFDIFSPHNLHVNSEINAYFTGAQNISLNDSFRSWNWSHVNDFIQARESGCTDEQISNAYGEGKLSELTCN